MEAQVNKYLVKVAMRLHQYADKDGKTRWIAEGKDIPEGFTKTQISFYRRKQSK